MRAAKRASANIVIHSINPDSLRGDVPSDWVCTGTTTLDVTTVDVSTVDITTGTVDGDGGRILGGTGSFWSITWIACPRFIWEADCNIQYYRTLLYIVL